MYRLTLILIVLFFSFHNLFISKNNLQILESSQVYSLISSDPDTLISMKRTACYGTCPAYELTIYENGDVRYFGKQFVAFEGEARSTISVETIEEIKRNIRESEFFKISTNPECETRYTDHPSVYLTVQTDGKKHHVNHYHGCKGFDGEKKLYDLEKAIDQLSGTQKWIEDESQ